MMILSNFSLPIKLTINYPNFPSFYSLLGFILINFLLHFFRTQEMFYPL